MALAGGTDDDLIGYPSPEFKVVDTYGEAITEEVLRGSPCLIIFFPFAFTPICDGELAALEESIREFDDVGILGVSCDPPAALRAFQEQRDFSFEMASDFWPHGQMARSFGAFDQRTGTATRASFLLDANGVVRWALRNPGGKARAVDDYARALNDLVGEGGR